jgi:hypothetical protein
MHAYRMTSTASVVVVVGARAGAGGVVEVVGLGAAATGGALSTRLSGASAAEKR